MGMAKLAGALLRTVSTRFCFASLSCGWGDRFLNASMRLVMRAFGSQQNNISQIIMDKKL